MLRAAVEGVDAGGLVRRAVAQTAIQDRITTAPTIDVIAAGKAAGVMLTAFVEALGAPPRSMIAIGPSPRPALLPAGAEWFEAGHPLPTEGSIAGARRAIDLATGMSDRGLLAVLLSGGGSALMALPVSAVSLEEKQGTVRLLLEHGADIHELNTVRKHLSGIKGGQLAAAARGRVLTLAVSDVVGDDLSVIASGPTVPDASTYHAALAVLARRGGRGAFPEAVVAHLERGAAGLVPETPKPGESRLAHGDAHVIGPQRGALVAAQQKAEALGYTVRVAAEPITGEARVAGVAHVARARDLLAAVPRPACLLASGETTVTVVGTGKGGRNQECAFAMGTTLQDLGPGVVAASFGTDGIDGPTDAAGAVVDTTTFARAAVAGIDDATIYLRNNDTYTFFDRLGDLIRTGPTNTNVGDVQVILVSD